MSRKPNIDQKLNQIFLILLGVVDGVTTHKEAYTSIEKVINGKPNQNTT